MRHRMLAFLYQWRWPLIMSVSICLSVFVAWRYAGVVAGVIGHPNPSSGEKDLSEIVKNYAQAFVWLAGGIFFGYKAFSGYQIVNLSVTVDAVRSGEKDSGNDFLKVAVSLSKGDRGTVQLHNIRGRIRAETGVTFGVLCFDVFRLDHDWRALGQAQRGVTTWDSLNPRNPLLNLAPNESTILSAYARIPRDAPCVIEVVVLGRRRSGIQMGQWRASCVSLPSGTSPKSSSGLFGFLQRLVT
jgi:hypothetical protein